jgi:transcriptional regulator with PAS, ATPase and Fis domain
MLVFTEEHVRPIQVVQWDTPLIEMERYSRQHKEPFLFVEKNKQILGYIKINEKKKNDQSDIRPSDLVPLQSIYQIVCGEGVSDLLQLISKEIVICKRQDSDEICGYLRRDDILPRLFQQEEFSYLFKTILSSIPMGILIVNQERRIVQYNDKALQILKREGKELKNSPIDQLFESEYIDCVFKKGETILNQLHRTLQWRVMVGFNPIFNNDREVTGMIIVVQDLPMLEEMAMELDYVKDLNKDLQAILATIYDEILVVDDRGDLLRTSESNISGFWKGDLKDLIGQNLVELEKQGLFRPSVTRLVLEKKGKVSIIQEGYKGKKVLAVGNPVYDEEGNLERIVIASRDITETSRLRTQLKQMKQLSEKYKKELNDLKIKESIQRNVIYCSPKIDRIMNSLKRIAQYSSTVLLTGESGVGKEVFAKAIHQLGPRAKKPFLQINCGAIPESLLESELFGYEKGAFTGADPKGKIGYFRQADQGVLFLDEIGEMPLALQVKLLRVLQEREVIPIGGVKPIPIDVQIITATNKNLEQMVEEGKFREDLFYRLNVIPIHIPPLRERPEDIPLLAYHFLQKWNQRYQRQMLLTPDALNLLEAYSWPGNVRELQNVIERVAVTTEEETITAGRIYDLLQWKKTSMKGKPIITEMMPLQQAMEEVEEQLILLAMERYKTTTLAAKMLGISQSSVSRKYQKILKKRANHSS